MRYPDSTTPHADRRRRVLDAMRAIRAEQGSGVSVEAVARGAGCSKQALGAQLGGENALMQERLRRAVDHLGAFDGRVSEPLPDFPQAHLDRIDEPDVVASFRFLSTQSPKFPEEARTIWRDSAKRRLDALTNGLSDAMPADCLSHDQPHVAAKLLLSMMVGMGRQRLVVGKRAPRAWAELSVDVFLRTFAPAARPAHC